MSPSPCHRPRCRRPLFVLSIFLLIFSAVSSFVLTLMFLFGIQAEHPLDSDSLVWLCCLTSVTSVATIQTLTILSLWRQVLRKAFKRERISLECIHQGICKQILLFFVGKIYYSLNFLSYFPPCSQHSVTSGNVTFLLGWQKQVCEAFNVQHVGDELFRSDPCTYLHSEDVESGRGFL